MRDRLSLGLPEIERVFDSADGTRRYLLRLADGKTVVLKLEDMKAVMQMQIDLDIKSADGEQIKTTILETINRVPG